MDPWCHSDITFQRMEGLVHRGLLYAWTSVEEWLLLGKEDLPSPPDGYIVLFTHFYEHGFATPAHKFLRGLLHYYKIKLQHLNPNGIQHMVAFVVLCEGFLRISPTLICGGTSLPSPSRRRGRRAVGKSCTCRWGVLASNFGTTGSVSTRR